MQLKLVDDNNTDASPLEEAFAIIENPNSRLTQETSLRAGLERHEMQPVYGVLFDPSSPHTIHHPIEHTSSKENLKQAIVILKSEALDRTAELERLNQILHMLSACNQALVRATDETALLHEICQIIITVGKYRMAWVGFAAEDEAKTVIPVASVGFEDGCLELERITWADTARGRGPTGSAIRTGHIRIGEDFLTDIELSPWRDMAIAQGFRSSIALPLASAGHTFGAVTIYASQPRAFEPRDIEILKELADDLAFGVTALRSQESLKRVEREVLEATEREQRRIGRDLHDTVQGNLAATIMMVGALKQSLAKCTSEQAKIMEVLNGLEKVIRDTINQTRGIARGLSPLELKSEGLLNALIQLAATTSHVSRVRCEFNCPTAVHV